MKKIALIIVAFCTFSCAVNKHPDFVSVKNFKILDARADTIKLSAEALFKNNNSIGGKLESDGIIVSVNNLEMATVSSKVFKVPAKKEFSVPLEVALPTKRVFNNNNLGGILNSLFAQKLKVHFKGVIKYKKLGFTYNYKVDQTEDVKVKF